MADSNDQPLLSKVALVTGGSRGLGKQMVLGFANAGADVVIAPLHPARLKGQAN